MTHHIPPIRLVLLILRALITDMTAPSLHQHRVGIGVWLCGAEFEVGCGGASDSTKSLCESRSVDGGYRDSYI